MIHGQLLLAIVMSVGVLVDPPAPRADKGTPTVQIDVCVIQLAADPPATGGADEKGASAAKPAVTPQRLTGSGDDVVVYLSPAEQPLALAGHTWDPAAKASAAPGEADRNRAWKTIAAPRVAVFVGREASVQIGAQVSYLEQRADGSLVVAHADAIEGLKVDANAKEADSAGVLLDGLSVQLTRVVGREPIPGVPFDVGRPILRTMATSTSLRLASDQVVIIEMPTVPGEQPVFVVVRAQVVASPT